MITTRGAFTGSMTLLLAISTVVSFVALGCKEDKPTAPDEKNTGKPGYGLISDSCNLLWGVECDSGTSLDKGYFVINHNDSWKIPYWVAYYLSDSNLVGNTERIDEYRPDPELPEEHRADNSDYSGSGYDRGHMAPAASFRRNREAMSLTFLLSNMCPQTSLLNRGRWRLLEDAVRDSVLSWGQAWIFTGVIFMDDDSNWIEPLKHIGDSVAVPTHCFKAVLLMTDDSLFLPLAYLMPNTSDSIPGKVEDCCIEIEKLEVLTGWTFFGETP